ncbi:MAG: bifunctional ADP-dependent NAD(P)H-hydrate dehydratase/NAD(P)H-hydrate epimerase [Micrococcales bacterium]|nr:bifunctional ADP-dependent NAD(P)H-hydrate dehydratase/NAD(P)H-hydrate epimerase [Micrococcales bacterium]
MICSYNAATIRECEKRLVGEGPKGRLMELAAHGAATVILREMRKRRDGRASGARILMLVGSGDNGGDALHAGAILARRGLSVVAIASSKRVHERGAEVFVQAGGQLLSAVDDGPGDLISIEDIAEMARRVDGIVDGIVGIGSRGPLTGHAAGLVMTLRVEAGLGAPMRHRRPNRPTVFAIDLPSGIGVDDGSVDGPVLPADITITLGAHKSSALFPPASLLFGRVELVDIGLKAPLWELGREPVARRLEAEDALDLWPLPRREDHKYTRGVLGVVAGSETYPGAAVLTTSAAVRAGVGMVRYLGPPAAVERVLSRRPEVVPGGGRVDAWALGPGVAAEADDQIERMRRGLDWARSQRVPAVLDAGAFACMPEGRLDPWIVLTPHAGELATLLSDRDIPTERSDVEKAPVRYAQLAAELLGGTVLLKGPATVVAGQCESVYVQADGTPWLATAGTGDVLTGLIGVLLAGTGSSAVISPEVPVQLAALAALVHGQAAERASGHQQEGGRTLGPMGAPISAMDVVDALPATVAALLARRAGHGAGAGIMGR